jgi:hypothetical protein
MRDTRTSLEKQLGTYLRQQPEGECLEFEELLMLVRRGHRARDHHRAMRHIAACPACRRAYLELRAIERMQTRGLSAWLRRFVSRPSVWAPAVGVAVAAIALVWWLWMPRGTQIAQQPPRLAHPEPPMASAPSEPKRAPAPPRLADETPRATKPPAEPPRPATPLERELASMGRVASFLREAAGAFTAILTAGSRAIDADAPNLQAPPIRLLEPDIERNAAIASTRPTFRWQPIEQAKGYQLQLREADSSRVLIETTLDATQTHYSLPSEARLARGSEYELVLTALREGVEPLTLRRRFSVLSDEQHKRWEWAQQHERTHPLLSAMVYYYHLDRYGDALRCLQRAKQRYPHDTEITRWLTLVEQRIRQREAEFSR